MANSAPTLAFNLPESFLMGTRLDSIVDDLRKRSEWARSDGPIEKRETHISIVLLGRRNVLKLKKPVNFGFLDYTGLEQRRLACHAEVTLNRRLCPQAYLGVRAVVNGGEGAELAGASASGAIDYGVWMIRLPDELMLDQQVRRGLVTEASIDAIARRLAAFFRAARRGPEVDVHGTPEAMARNWEENFAQMAPYAGRTISRGDLESLRTWVWTWMEQNAGLLRERVREQRIVEGHGDVRCESVCLTGEICIFDCIEFNERFRANDPANEAAFLAADLDAHGRPDLGYYFTERFAAHSGDAGIWPLLPFFRCYRAFVRGKVHSFVTSDSGIPAEDRERALRMAAHWLDLARRYASPLARPAVIAVCGYSGSGKTSLARSIAGELGLRAVSSDTVRAGLFGERKQQEAFGQGIYSAEANRATYRRMMEMAGELAAKHGGVVLDATFRCPAERECAGALAAGLGVPLRVVHCQLPPEIARQRLADRAGRKDGDSDATWEIYECQQRMGWTPWRAESLEVDTTGPLAATASQVAGWLRRVG